MRWPAIVRKKQQRAQSRVPVPLCSRSARGDSAKSSLADGDWGRTFFRTDGERRAIAAADAFCNS